MILVIKNNKTYNNFSYKIFLIFLTFIMRTLQGPNYGSFKMIILISFEDTEWDPKTYKKTQNKPV